MPSAPPASGPALVVLIDTNVILDVALALEPWVHEATLLLDHASRGTVRAFVAGHAVTTLYYIVERARGQTVAVGAVSDLLSILDVVELGAADFQRALTFRLRDYEDAVQAAACLRVGAAYLVTRNPKDFTSAPVTTRSAGEVLALLSREP